MFNKLKDALPLSWFGDNTSVIDSVLSGFAWCSSLIYDNITEAKKQTRIKTATGGFLDMISGDFFGDTLPRTENESDFIFSIRILDNLLREKATFAAVCNTANSLMLSIGATINIYEYGSVNSGEILLESGDDILLEDGITPMYSETSATLIPNGSYPVGLNIGDAAVRYTTPLQPFEALVVITGAGALAGTVLLEGGTDLLAENGDTINVEYTDQSSYQFLIDALMKVKPIGTVVWVSIT